MANFTILGTAPGSRIDWIGAAADRDTAWAEFADMMGEVDASEYRVIEMSDAAMAQVTAWILAGQPAADAPDFLG